MSHSTYYVPLAFLRTFQDPQSRTDTPRSGTPQSGNPQSGTPAGGSAGAAGGGQGAAPMQPGAGGQPAAGSGNGSTVDNPMQQQQQQGKQEPVGPCGGDMIWLMPAMLALMYFMIFRPEQKRRKQQQALLAAIKVGDHVVMLSGMHGDVISLTEKTVTVRVDSIAMTFDRSAVGRIDRDEATEAEAKS